MTITYQLIDEHHSSDINLKNNSFRLYGRMIPSYINEKWDYSTELFDKKDVETLCFPDENYSYDMMKKDHFFVGAYDNHTCVGLAIYKKGFFKYMYLYDLKVNEHYRKQGIGKKLISYGQNLAQEHNFNGLYTQAQDNNLAACLFYLDCGFEIGGLDTKVYNGTPQENKKDIYFYLDN